MNDYDTMRHFADSWGLVFMLAVFLAVVVWVFRRGSNKHYRDAARIPLDDDKER
jgi:cytochrome c oxidase cbb3-type subunit 4